MLDPADEAVEQLNDLPRAPAQASEAALRLPDVPVPVEGGGLRGQFMHRPVGMVERLVLGQLDELFVD